MLLFVHSKQFIKTIIRLFGNTLVFAIIIELFLRMRVSNYYELLVDISLVLPLRI